MSEIPTNPRRRPLEPDALGLLAVVHALGERPHRGGRRRSARIVGEGRLQGLLHLARDPLALAYVAMDRARGAELAPGARHKLARDVRRLLATADAKAPGNPRRTRFHAFDPGTWWRLDDLLAWLVCRDLLEVRPADGEENDDEIAYHLTEAGERTLDAAENGTFVAPAERCRLLDGLGSIGLGSIGLAELRAVGERLDTFRHEHQLDPEDDLVPALFRATFGEQL